MTIVTAWEFNALKAKLLNKELYYLHYGVNFVTDTSPSFHVLTLLYLPVMEPIEPLKRPAWLDEIEVTLRPGEEKPLGTGCCTNPRWLLPSQRKKRKAAQKAYTERMAAKLAQEEAKTNGTHLPSLFKP